MRRHVYHVSRAGHDAWQTIGAWQSAFRVGGCLDGMDVEMVGAGMIGILGEDFFQRGDDFFGARLRFAIVRPEFPRVQIDDASA